MKNKGATRHKPMKVKKSNWVDFKYMKSISLAITAVSCVVVVVVLLLHLVNREVTNLKIVTKNIHVSEQDIKAELKGVFPDSYISLDLHAVSEKLLAMVMVADVNIEKVWPDTLNISIFEERPVAIWNGKFMLSQEGEILPLAITDLELPNLQGSDSQLVMQHFLLFNRWGKRHNLNLKSLSHSSAGWKLSHDNELIMWLDNVNAMGGLKQLERVISQFDIARINQIDLRYEQGFAVAWKPSTDDQGQG